MRRYLSLMESNFPTELGNAYRAMENSGNPWGLSQSERADWAKDLEGIEIIDGSSPLEGTLATTALAIAQGADIVRVHDVKANVRVARMTDAVVRAAPLLP